jgi:thiamine-phosphate pyrophosphorylase
MRAPRLYVVTDRRLAGGDTALVDLLRAAATAAPPGTLAVQVREKDLAPREVVALARAIVEALAPLGAPVLVNDRFDLALAAGAAGVHLPASGLAAADVRAVYGGVVAVSAHRVGELTTLRPGDADFAVFGPVFDTPSKRAYGPPRGIDALREAAARSPVPVVALGGIDTGNAGLLRGTGVAGLAVIRAVLGAADPAAAVRGLLEATEGGGGAGGGG